MDITVLAVAGSTPIAATFVLMAGLRWSAVKALSVGWLLASGLGLALWRLDWSWWAASAVYGALQAVEIVIIIFGALLLMNHLQRSGAMQTIRGHFSSISEDRRIQLLLIGLGFVTIIEGAAGFGTPGALGAPLLIGLGFPPLSAAVFALYFNGPQPPFGAAGTPVIGGIGSVIDATTLEEGMVAGTFLRDVGSWTATMTGAALVFWGLLGVFLLLFWFGRDQDRCLGGAWRATLAIAPFALVLGATTGAVQFLVAWFFGPELPDIAAGFASLGIGILLARKGVLMPKKPWTFPNRENWPEAWYGGIGQATLPTAEPRAALPVFLAWTPYLLVALVLLVTRWPGLGIFEWIRSFSLRVPGILGHDLPFSLRYLQLPGLVPFLPVTLLTWLIHRMPADQVREAWGKTIRQILIPAATLVIAVSMTQVIIQSATNPLNQPGMMQAVSRTLAEAAGDWIPFVAPWVGALGTFITGSTTSSNILFSALLHDSASSIGVSRTLIVALQNTGAGIGNMVSILNIAAICGVIGMRGTEGILLRKILVPFLLFTILAGLAGLALVGLLPELY